MEMSKLKKVLICSRKDRKYVAKIADFDFSIVEVTESSEVWIGSTNPWKVPETAGPIALKALSRTDVFSYGLLAWLVCIDSQIPFNLVISQNLQGTARVTEIETLKQKDKLLAAARTENWLLKWLHDQHGPKLDGIFEKAIKVLSMQNFAENDLTARYQQMSQKIYDEFYQKICQAQFLRKLDAIFERALQSESDKRDLRSIIDLLESDFEISQRLVNEEGNIILRDITADSILLRGSAGILEDSSTHLLKQVDPKV